MSKSLATALDASAPLEHPAPEASIQVFSTCPSSLMTPDNYPDRVIQVARWSERAGCTGILVYTDNSLVDPWLVSHLIIQNTRALCPLVAEASIQVFSTCIE